LLFSSTNSTKSLSCEFETSLKNNIFHRHDLLLKGL
jgi:hypothetical protein